MSVGVVVVRAGRALAVVLMAKDRVIWVITIWGARHFALYRHYYLAQHFSEDGHRRRIICASFHHLLTKLPEQAQGQVDRDSIRLDQGAPDTRRTTPSGREHGRFLDPADVCQAQAAAPAGCCDRLFAAPFRRLQRLSNRQENTAPNSSLKCGTSGR